MLILWCYRNYKFKHVIRGTKPSAKMFSRYYYNLFIKKGKQSEVFQATDSKSLPIIGTAILKISKQIDMKTGKSYTNLISTGAKAEILKKYLPDSKSHRTQ